MIIVDNILDFANVLQGIYYEFIYLVFQFSHGKLVLSTNLKIITNLLEKQKILKINNALGD